MSSAANPRELRDEEEEEDEGEDSEEEEDEDYVPNAKELEDDDDDDDDDGLFDDDIPEVGSGAPDGGEKASSRKRARTAGKTEKKPKATKGAKAGKAAKAAKKPAFVDEDEDGDELGGGGGRGGGARAARTNAPTPKAEAPATTNVDALWAELQGGDKKVQAPARQPAAAPSTDASGRAECTGSGGSGGGLDIKALLAKTSGACGSAAPSSGSATGQVVEIQTKMDFCGEEVMITKRVKVGSAEEVAHRQQAADAPTTAADKKAAPGASVSAKSSLVSSAFATSAELRKQMHAAPAKASIGAGSSLRTDASLEFKPMLPPPKLPGLGAQKPTGLQGLLASIDGKKKMSTMDKSRHDWGAFKSTQDDHTRSEMDKFAKDGYLAKQAFLARAGDRQAEVARGNRRRGMGLPGEK